MHLANGVSRRSCVVLPGCHVWKHMWAWCCAGFRFTSVCFFHLRGIWSACGFLPACWCENPLRCVIRCSLFKVSCFYLFMWRATLQQCQTYSQRNWCFLFLKRRLHSCCLQKITLKGHFTEKTSWFFFFSCFRWLSYCTQLEMLNIQLLTVIYL